MPFSILAGVLAGLVGKKLFSAIWGAIDDEEPPDGKHLEISFGKLLLAAAVQGAIFRAVREATEHGTRRAFMNLTGSWPGERRPDPE